MRAWEGKRGACRARQRKLGGVRQAVTSPVSTAGVPSRMVSYLTILLGTPAVETGDVTAWRTPPSLR